jgi:hypothetical protein
LLPRFRVPATPIAGQRPNGITRAVAATNLFSSTNYRHKLQQNFSRLVFRIARASGARILPRLPAEKLAWVINPADQLSANSTFRRSS